MGIALYQHNQEAYRKVCVMLENKGRAAVIHPTGTGKSLIGFKLCEEHPEAEVCWIGPSDYIFRTQADNVRKLCDGWIPENIRFYTYARLCNLSGEELGEIHPDYIILDEFHRCGAQVWGLGVCRLLARYSGAQVLGLSATAIRYLDNQRDMAEELFDGNVASEMTLGEAIVRGILQPPNYVLSLYSWQNQLSAWEERIRKLPYQGQREKADRYLEALRRALDRAEKLDELFDRYMQIRDGRYIVFCSNYETMQTAMEKAGSWFGKVDGKPHIYSVYSEDPGSKASFEAFQSDDTEGHLKLLYCIDALNEGVHVAGVAGVVLLRPTVSPIVYKQQIGRALSASGNHIPVIFDVVNNIEGLYSIDAVREEMELAMEYFRLEGREAYVVNQGFEVLGNLRNCMELFDALEQTLTSTWETMYLQAKKYYMGHGTLNVPQRYFDDEGYPLGRWLTTQRASRRNGDAALDEERIAKLDAIGMDWSYAEDRLWQKGYGAAEHFFKEHGHLDVPAGYKAGNGFPLGRWYRNIRKRYQDGTLPDGYVKALEKIGAKWDSVLERNWLSCYEQAKAYYGGHQSLDVPVDYRTEDGFRLGAWLSGQRERYARNNMTQEQIRMLEDIGMTWNRYDSQWDQAFHAVKRYRQQGGDINAIPADYKADGFKLAVWIRTQRTRYMEGKLADDRISRLEELGIVWKPFEALWNEGYMHACAFAEVHGSLQVPAGYISPDGYKLKNWLNNQTTRYKNGRLTEEQREKLERIGMKWKVREKQAG